jgi:poly(A) polymerase
MPAAPTDEDAALAVRLNEQPFAPVLHKIGVVAARENIDVYLVGGAVRDLLIGRSTTDLDFVTVGKDTGIRLAEAVSDALGGTTAHVYENFGTAAVRLADPWPDQDETVLEFVAARTESYRSTSRKPAVEAASLGDDLRRRDFTVNALAADLHPDRFGALRDAFDGRSDLERGLLRTPLDPEATFEDDPLRMVRAARFAAQLGFEIEEATFAGMREKAARVEILSQERITEELRKTLNAPTPSTGFDLLERAGLLTFILPELTDLKGVEERDGERHKDNFYHTLQVVDNLADLTSDRPPEETHWLRWAALLHDIAKPKTKRWKPERGWTFDGHEHEGARWIPDLFRRLKLPTGERMQYVRKLVQLHHRPADLTGDDVTDSAVRRLLYDAGDDADDLMTLVRADITSGNPRRVERYRRAFDRVEQKMQAVEEKDRIRNFQPPVDGNEIMDALGIGEGVAIGILKDHIKEAILEGEIPNEHDAAYAYMMRMKDEALRRGRLFDTMHDRLDGPERRALGAIKEVLFTGALPDDDEAALKKLERVKAATLADY